MPSMLNRVLCVEPLDDGRWAVGLEPSEPLSIHASANEAESVARRQAEAMDVERILLRDRYGRIRTLRRDSASGGRFRS